MLTIANVGWDDLKDKYMEESFHRGAFWIINDYPELNRTEADPAIDAERVPKSFASGYVLFHVERSLRSFELLV